LSKGNILIIDDEENLRVLMAKVIALEGFNVIQAKDARSGLKLVDDSLQVVVTDVKLPDGNGVELTRKIKEQFSALEVIVLTAFGTINDGVSAMKNGAFDYLIKGDDNEKIIPLLHKAVEKSKLQVRILHLESSLQQKFGFENVLGKSQVLQRVIADARKVSPTDTTVLLLGETGTGKEVFAKAIHHESSRKSKPFVALNCSAISKDLLESELFGHVAGAFTGALKDKKGLLEEAQDGTFFLDEIGELSPELQAKLLRVLENGEFYRVGDSKPRKTSVRFIAATNRALSQEAENGKFRSDLYFRLSVFQIQLPSLNERQSDIPLLTEYFIKLSAERINKPTPQPTPDFLKMLQQHSWKGNIRELKNVIERAVILCDDQLTPAHLPFDFISSSADVFAFDLATVEKNHIQKVLRHTQGNKTETARLLNIGLTTLYRKIEEYKIS
jgi:two-component system, NtrC family, response regulator